MLFTALPLIKEPLKAAHEMSEPRAVSGAFDVSMILYFRKEHGFNMVEIYVRQNNVDQALRALKKKLQNEGILREMKARKHYEKPSEKRVREQAEAVRRARKLARKRAQIEGLIPAKKRKPRR